MVHGAISHHSSGGNPSFWVHLHRNVFHLHIILGLQNLLRVRIHASRYCHCFDTVYSDPNSGFRAVFLILLTVTVCVTIVCTYFLLNAEDYRWQWTSFLSAASTAGYVYFYSFYYFFFKTKYELLAGCQRRILMIYFFRMYGLFQTTFYFGYMALFSLGLGLMCGTLGYVGTALFVRRIYGTVKID